MAFPPAKVLLAGDGSEDAALATRAAVNVAPRLLDRAPALIGECEALIARAVTYAKEHLEDMPEIRDWVWSP